MKTAKQKHNERQKNLDVCPQCGIKEFPGFVASKKTGFTIRCKNKYHRKN